MAKSFVSRLRKSASRLRDNPQIGWVVEEFEDPTIREIVFEDYRIIHQYVGVRIAILAVHPGSQPLTAFHLRGE